MADLLTWQVPGESFITVLGEIINIQPSRASATVEGIIEYLNRSNRTFTLRILDQDASPSLISVSLLSRARLSDSGNRTITINSIAEGMKVQVTGKTVFNGNGILADQVQVKGD